MFTPFAPMLFGLEVLYLFAGLIPEKSFCICEAGGRFHVVFHTHVWDLVKGLQVPFDNFEFPPQLLEVVGFLVVF